jgi:hypothetical protein
LFEQSVKGRADSAGRIRPSFGKDKNEDQIMVDLERINLMEPIEFETWVLIQIKLPVKAFNRLHRIINWRFNGKSNLTFLLSRLI